MPSTNVFTNLEICDDIRNTIAMQYIKSLSKKTMKIRDYCTIHHMGGNVYTYYLDARELLQNQAGYVKFIFDIDDIEYAKKSQDWKSVRHMGLCNKLMRSDTDESEKAEIYAELEQMKIEREKNNMDNLSHIQRFCIWHGINV